MDLFLFFSELGSHFVNRIYNLTQVLKLPLVVILKTDYKKEGKTENKEIG